MIGKRLFRLAGVVVVGLALVLSFGAVSAQDATPEAQTQQPYLGVSIAAAETGAHVTAVAPNGPAERAGIQANDVITTFDDQKVTADSLATAVGQHQVGDSVKLSLLRGEQTVDVTVTLAARPTTMTVPAFPGNQGNQGNTAPAEKTPYIGIALSDTSNAVTIEQVAAGSPAETAGFKVGDVITRIGDTDVKSGTDVVDAVRAAKPGDKLTLHVTRSGEDVSIDVTVGETTMQSLNRGGMNGVPFGGDQGNGNEGNGLPFNFGQQMGGVHLGVQIVNLDAATAKEHNLTVTDGALVMAVEPGSPAEKAGIKVNDVITAIDGDKVTQRRTLSDRLYGWNDGDEITVTVLRDGQSIDLKATLVATQMNGQNMMPNLQQFFGSNGDQNGNGFTVPNIPAPQQTQPDQALPTT